MSSLLLTGAGPSGGAGAIPPDLYWESDTNVTGSPASAWGDKGTNLISLAQGTAGNRPAVTASVFGSTQGLVFDGSNDTLTFTALGTFSTTDPGSLAVIFKTGTVVTGITQCIVSNSNSAVANDYFELGIGTDGRLFITNNVAGTSWTMGFPTVLDPSTAYHVVLCYDGTDYFLTLNGVEENPQIMTSGTFAANWIGHSGATNTLAVGALVLSTGNTHFLNGSIGGVYFWTQDIST